MNQGNGRENCGRQVTKPRHLRAALGEHLPRRTGTERAITLRQVMARVATGQAGGDKFKPAFIPMQGAGTEPERQAAAEQNG